MKEYKLKDIAKIISGGTAPKENFFDESIGIPFIRAGHLEMLCNGNSMDYIPKIKDEKLKGLVKVPKDTIVFAKSGMSCMKARVYKLEKEAYIVNHLVGIICDELVEPNYLKYYFKYNKPNKLVLDSSYPSIRLSDISEIRIKLPSNEIQLKVSNILDKAQNLIDKRKEQLEALDELVKSKFIEMFGDPVLNPKSWNVKRVIDVCDCMVPGRDKPKSFTGNTPWITIEDLEVNSITYKSKSNLALTDDEINEVKRKKVPKNSVLMSCVGNLGICSIAGKEMIINQQLHSFQCKDINNFFLMHYLGFRKDYMISQASSTTVLYMNKTTCNSIPVYLPPIELQNQFSEFVKQVDKLKFEIEKSLKELEDNFNSLMQKAFKGKLFK
ncbi:restriction endonuclease subunit S [Clostridium perfringens]|uniref:restriction endonuclease subunit S n=1 Tax=Clostridium perfringens TaxID=1502 RepID=UPI0039ED976B